MKGMTVLGTLGLAALLAVGPLAVADTGRAYDAQIQSKLAQELARDKKLKDVRASVDNGIVTLEGSVASYQAKLDAEKKAQKAGKKEAVRDLVEVSGPAVSDQQLQETLAKKLRYSWEDQGSVFDAFSLGVKDGVVTLQGEAWQPWDKQSALDLVASTPGVKGLVDQVKVLPPSPMDNALRLRIARAIYSDPVLSKYAIDPQAPIRIVVDGGRVALFGTVNNKMDKQIAGMRANQVWGTFGVENHLSTAEPQSR